MNKLFLLLPAAGAALLLSACEEEPYYGHVYGGSAYYGGPAYVSGPAYYDGGGVDFYYVSGHPYSHAYGPLVYRDNNYYYGRGGSYTVYNRSYHSGPTYAHYGHGGGYGYHGPVYHGGANYHGPQQQVYGHGYNGPQKYLPNGNQHKKHDHD